MFAELSDDNLNWLMSNGEHVTIRAGEALMTEGSLPDAFYVVLDGGFEVVKQSGHQEVTLAIRGAGEMMGEMSLIEDRPRTATVRAIKESHLLKISREMFKDLLCGNASTALAILRTVMARLRNTEAMVRQNEKLVSLGTLAAGLAHELNNPAAAARRSSEQLSQTISNWLRARSALDALQLDPELSELVVVRLREDMARRAKSPVMIDPLARSDREGAIEAFLDEFQFDDAWEYAPALVTYGWDATILRQWSAVFDAAQLPAVMRWLAMGYLVHSLIEEVNESASRVSEIVRAVKSYTYLDQAPIQEIDVTEGIENTVVILKHKLKQGVNIVRMYDGNLPRIEAYASELNQVWTNIIDNAIDAMNGHGELTLRTARQNGDILIEIGNNGPPIPAAMMARIFEPFYSTKGVNGTGLGLHITYNIVQKHHGRIDVTSEAGDTRFRVTLPIQLRS